MQAIRQASDGFEKRGSGVEGLNAGRVERERPIAIGNGLRDPTRGPVSGSAVHIAFSEEALWSATPAVDDLAEVADGFGVETGVESGDGGSASANEELDVAEKLRYGLGFGKGPGRSGGRVCGGDVAGEIGEWKTVVGPAYAFSPECGGGESFSGLEKSHGILHEA